MRIVLLSFFLLLFSCESDYRESYVEVDQLFKKWDTDSTAGASLAIFKKGRLYYKSSYGMANLDHSITLSPKSVFYAGSVSKQFVAMAMLLLEEEGKIDLSEDIRTYFPEFPDYGHKITFYHLLYHTSGIRDYLDMWEISGRHYIDYYDDDAVLDIIIRQSKLNHPPGENYMYCNSGYFLMQKVIKRITGKTFAEYSSEKILKPLGMENSHFHDNYTHLIKNRASGYRNFEDNSYGSIPMRFDLVGSGGLYTTVEDMEKWDSNFYRNKLGKKDQSLIDRMNQSGKYNDGQNIDYGLAQKIQYYRGYTGYFHNGVMGGYRAFYGRIPGLETSIVILSNVEQFKPDFMALDIFDIVLKEHFVENRLTKKKPENKKEEEFEAHPNLPLYLGSFYNEELDARYRFRIEADNVFLLWGNNPEVKVNIDNYGKFKFSDFSGHFNSDFTEIQVKGWGMGPFIFKKIQ